MTIVPANFRFDGPIVVLDVRDDLRQRREPFARIMATVAALGERDVLHLRATFEPVPLLKAMAKRGFAHQVQEHAPDDWSVWFHRPAGAGATCTVPTSAAAAAERVVATRAPADGLVLDVRGLEPPEPMVRTLAALEALPSGAALVQVNERIPQFLLPLLTERGFVYEIDASAADRVVVRIRRAE